MKKSDDRILTTHVGSIPRSPALRDLLVRFDRGEAVDETALDRATESAIRDVVRLQEDIGLKVATDGEFNRGSWQRDFLLRLDNVALIPSRLTVRFHSRG